MEELVTMIKDGALNDIQEALQQGRISLEELVRSYLTQIEETKSLNIYVEVFEQEALSKARQLDEKRRSGLPLGLLHGAVISIKDVLCYQSHVVTAGSKILDGFESQFTGTAVQRLIDEDAVIIGRTNCDEFAMGSTNENSCYGPTLNGLDPTRVPGGSSGGAAVAVERDTCLVSIGSDTGGSVRQPASFCGVYGMKPTYGRISRYGLIAYGSSFDQIGIISKNIADISKVLHVISGRDEMDATSLDLPPCSIVDRAEDKRYKIAYIPEVLEHEGLNPVIRSSIIGKIEELSQNGHQCTPIHFDLLPYLVPAYYVLTTAEASSNLSRYDGIRYGHSTTDSSDIEEIYEKTRSDGFGKEVKRRIMMGTFVLSVGYFDAYFTKAQKVRRLINNKLEEIYKSFDYILLPTTTDIAWEKGQIIDDPVKMYLSDIYTVLANLGGYPAISIPVRSDELNMPFGIQLMGDKYQEDRLLALSLTIT